MLDEITDDLVDDLAGMRFGEPVTHVYNPLRYARAGWDRYCALYGRAPRRVLLLGMNPGPFGMAQVGVPFGEIAHVRDWLGIRVPIGAPPDPHPKRPVEGFACSRSEVSGRRLWSWARERYGRPEAFFDTCFVANYCPLVFMEASGRNRVPSRLPVAERRPLFAACDHALSRTIDHFQPEILIGIGRFAERRAKALTHDRPVRVAQIPHPSPASPLANRGWAPLADAVFDELGL